MSSRNRRAESLLQRRDRLRADFAVYVKSVLPLEARDGLARERAEIVVHFQRNVRDMQRVQRHLDPINVRRRQIIPDRPAVRRLRRRAGRR